MTDDILAINRSNWDKIASNYFGKTALPEYGPLIATEEELNLLGSIAGKRVLDIGCGSGHSLEYMNNHEASELWGLDISATQIDTARKYLKGKDIDANLICASMEEDIGLPKDYFDIVYSIYAIGWTTNLRRTLELVYSYLKKDGMFVFSWDHPMFQCIDEKGDDIIITRSYLEEGFTHIDKHGEAFYINRIKFSTYIRELSRVGFKISEIIEGDLSQKYQDNTAPTKGKYYSLNKGKMVPSSFIIKTTKT